MQNGNGPRHNEPCEFSLQMTKKSKYGNYFCTAQFTFTDQAPKSLLIPQYSYNGHSKLLASLIYVVVHSFLSWLVWSRGSNQVNCSCNSAQTAFKIVLKFKLDRQSRQVKKSTEKSNFIKIFAKIIHQKKFVKKICRKKIGKKKIKRRKKK